MKKLATAYSSAEIDTLLVISPHGLVYPDKFNICGMKKLFGTFSNFDHPELIVDGQNDLDFVDDTVFDLGFSGASNRPSGTSSLGFEFTESAAEMNFDIHHSHLDMGYITQNKELDHVKDFI